MIASAAPSRFAGWPPWAARLALALLLGLAVYGALPNPHPTENFGRPPQWRDWMLYRLEVERVMRGEDYYAAAAAEHRLHRYPTTPPQVFREPTLIWVLAALRTDLMRRLVLILLSLVTLVALWRALLRTGVSALRGLVATFLAGGTIMLAWTAISPYSHEIWSGLLVALSLATHAPGRWRLSALLGLAACFIRELSVLYLLVMAAFALSEKNWSELRDWILAIGLFAILFAWHLAIAARAYAPGDLTFSSAGWIHFGGWPFVVDASKTNILVAFVPRALLSVWVCLGIAGLAGARSSFLSRAAAVVGGYMIVFLAVGLPANTYWGLLYAPLLPMGIVLAPEALRDLALKSRS